MHFNNYEGRGHIFWFNLLFSTYDFGKFVYKS